MTHATAAWLRDHFAQVADVRVATTEPDNTVIFQTHQADLVVSTWMGARFYVYLLDAIPKVRDLKNTLRDNSRAGIGTLFVLDAALLPAAGSTLKAPEWQEILSALNDGWIYAYTRCANQPALQQVHYNQTQRRGHYDVWHLSDFHIDSVSVRKRELHDTLRGTWRVADIASTAYKRRVNDERANQRFHYQTKYTQEIPNSANGRRRQATRSATATNKAKLESYYNLLGVSLDASEKEIKRAFRQMALKVHPDVSALPRHESHRRIKELNEAYDFIKQHNGWH